MRGLPVRGIWKVQAFQVWFWKQRNRWAGGFEPTALMVFSLDRGFQILLTAYPEARNLLDFPALRLKAYEPGALIRYQGKFHPFVDPLRRPAKVFSTLRSPIATFGDKLRLARLKIKSCRGQMRDIYSRPETSTLERLKSEGFSDGFIQRFFSPFLGGVFLEPDLVTSTRKFDLVFRMFSSGDSGRACRGNGGDTTPARFRAAKRGNSSQRSGKELRSNNEHR